jgi:hypothetical protein
LLYKKKHKLSKNFYRTHLECAKQWNTCIPTSVESKLPSVKKVLYNRLNKKKTFRVLIVVYLPFACVAKLATKIKIWMFGHNISF